MTLELTFAIQQNDFNLVKELIELGCDVNEMEDNEFGYTPLIWASQKGLLPIIKYLVEDCKAEIGKKDKKGCSCLFRAAMNNHLSSVIYLHQKCPSLIDEPSNRGTTPLWMASANNHIDVIEYLLTQNVNVENKDTCEFEMTPFMVASQQGNLQAISMLAEEGKCSCN